MFDGVVRGWAERRPKTEKPTVSSGFRFDFIWLRGQDLNLRPLGYERVLADEPSRTISSNGKRFNSLRLTRVGVNRGGLAWVLGQNSDSRCGSFGGGSRG